MAAKGRTLLVPDDVLGIAKRDLLGIEVRVSDHEDNEVHDARWDVVEEL